MGTRAAKRGCQTQGFILVCKDSIKYGNSAEVQDEVRIMPSSSSHGETTSCPCTTLTGTWYFSKSDNFGVYLNEEGGLRYLLTEKKTRQHDTTQLVSRVRE